MTPPEVTRIARREVPTISRSTVYRLLNALVVEGNILRVELAGQPTRFEAASHSAGINSHHHHFHCNSCERVYPIEGCPGSMKALVPRGFRVEGHDLVLHGRCPSCARSRNTSQRPVR